MYVTKQLDEVLDVQVPPYLVEGFLRKNTLTCFSAEPHVGKTMMMLDLMLCMESKQRYLGVFDVVQTSSTIFIGLDSPQWDLKLQLDKLSKGRKLSRSDLKMMDSRILGRGQAIRPNIFDKDFFDWLRGMRDDHDISTIFIDTKRRIHDLDENSSKDMDLVMGKFEQMVDKEGMTIVFSTHTSKPSGNDRSTNYGIRGSTVIPGALDFHYHLFLTKKNRVVIEGAAKRRGESRGKGDLFIDFVPANGGLLLVASEDGEGGESVDKIVAALAEGELSAKDLEAKTGLGYWNIQRILRTLQTSDRVVKLRRGVWALSGDSSS